MTSFNDGIEAAAQWMDELARQQATITGMAEDAHNSRTIAQNIRALKRPEPSEEERAYLRDQTCILRKGKHGDTVICGQSVVEGHLRQGYQFDWKATDEARARDRAVLKAMEGE